MVVVNNRDKARIKKSYAPALEGRNLTPKRPESDPRSEKDTLERHKPKRVAPPPPKAKPKKKKARDPLIDHPAIVLYKEKVKYNVPTMWRAKVVAAVGDRAKEWGELIDQWIGLGWKPTNVSGMIDSFKNGGIKPRRNNGSGSIHAPEKLPPGLTKEQMRNAKPIR